MSPEAIAAFVQLGIAGTMLYLFVTGKIVTASSMTEALKRADSEKALIRAWGNDWREQALGTEDRLDDAVPVLAAAVGAEVPEDYPATPRRRLSDDYAAADRAVRRRRR